MEYKEERVVCEFLGLRIDKGGWVLAWYGYGSSRGNLAGWQVVCHLSKLKMYLTNKIHKNHHEKVRLN